MGVFHFLNVKQGDCSIIEHASGHVTVIDVCNARLQTPAADSALSNFLTIEKAYAPGNFGQKDVPVNPIEYMKARGITSIFRFLATHPDMDHLDGIKDLFAAFTVWNFWDTKHKCDDKVFGNNSPYREEDWIFYNDLRNGKHLDGPKILTPHSGDRNKYWNMDDEGGGGDGLHILSPTPEIIAAANDSGDFNDSSLVVLYKSAGGSIIIAGDSHDKTWDHIIENHYAKVKDIDVLVAPHHGRDSERDFKFLDVLRPKLTLFGNASSEHLAYAAWSNRKLPVITNNQANCIIIDTNSAQMEVYVTNHGFAKSVNPNTFFSATHGGYWLFALNPVSNAA